MGDFEHRILKEIRCLDRIRYNYFVERKFNALNEMDEIDFILEYSRLDLLNRRDLIDELKKEHFLKIVRIHPESRTIPIHRVLNYWQTIQFNSN